MKRHENVLLVCLSSGLALSACGSKAKTTGAPQPVNMGDIKLSSALQITLPDSLEKAGGATAPASNLRLADRKKSMEACEAMTKIDESVSDARSTGSFLCHLEVEKIDFGKKYNITFKNIPDSGDVDAQVWVDNSDTSAIKIYYCNNKKLVIKASLSGYSGAGLIKGSTLMKFDQTDANGNFSYLSNLDFDFTIQGVKIAKSSTKSTFSMQGNSGDTLSYAEMKLVDSGVSSLLVSKGGTYNSGGYPGSYDDQAAVLFNGTMGQALSKNMNYFSRATFDKDGYKVSTSSATSDVVVDKASLPAKLESTFSPEAPVGWDCSTNESMTIDLQAADKKSAHDACEIDWPEYNCASSDFERGETEQ
jgi:hypothetical protein